MMQGSGKETHLFLVRHGETDFNRRRIVQGRGVDVPLNALGIKQALALSERAVEMDLDVIYASTLIRARQTAQFVSQRIEKAPLYYLQDLEEMSWGRYEGLEVSNELRAEFDLLKDEWRKGNYGFAIGGGESAIEVRSRGLNALTHIVDQHRGGRVMVVAHGRFLRILIASILKEYGLERMEEIKHANTGVNYITHSDAGYTVHFLDNTDHLVSVN